MNPGWAAMLTGQTFTVEISRLPLITDLSVKNLWVKSRGHI